MEGNVEREHGAYSVDYYLDSTCDAGLLFDGRHVLEVIDDPVIRREYGIDDVSAVLRAAFRGVNDPYTFERYDLRSYLVEALDGNEHLAALMEDVDTAITCFF